MTPVRTSLVLGLLLSSTAVLAVDGDQPPAKRPAAGRRASVSEIDRSAVGFAREHHPELADLLERMRESNPRAYRAAIQDLSKDRQRLERLRDRAPERYDSELQLWSLDSQIRLLAARAAKGNAAEIRPRLEELLQQRQEFRLNRLRQERERLSVRMQRVEATIRDLEAHPPTDADVDALLTRVKSRMQTARRDARPAESVSVDQREPAPVDSPSPTDSPQD